MQNKSNPSQLLGVLLLAGVRKWERQKALLLVLWESCALVPPCARQASQGFRETALGSLQHGEEGHWLVRALTLSTVKFIICNVGVPAAGNEPTTWYQVPYLHWTQTVIRVGPQALCEPVGFN